MAKLNGVVVYRERYVTRPGFRWAVRVYRNGKILFQSAEYWHKLHAALDAARMVNGHLLNARVQIGTEYIHVYEHDLDWLKGWVDAGLRKEAKREEARVAKSNRRFVEAARAFSGLPPLDRGSSTVKTHVPAFIPPKV